MTTRSDRRRRTILLAAIVAAPAVSACLYDTSRARPREAPADERVGLDRAHDAKRLPESRSQEHAISDLVTLDRPVGCGQGKLVSGGGSCTGMSTYLSSMVPSAAGTYSIRCVGGATPPASVICQDTIGLMGGLRVEATDCGNDYAVGGGCDCGGKAVKVSHPMGNPPHIWVCLCESGGTPTGHAICLATPVAPVSNKGGCGSGLLLGGGCACTAGNYLVTSEPDPGANSWSCRCHPDNDSTTTYSICNPSRDM